ncbi:hypothetical protein HPB52_013457 [Rhipicephalus sanguineus]|uniref:Uncharacterized protein n=1 Tax=Rhipicephalus sanguineus TaxID=34632 RepID=A0A9D4SNF1_RHISA|nr:hypothetical protein HPB52_013457 [Rhipicephalus sanguineus]
MPPEKDKISSAVRGAICVDPVPRNIHPVHSEGRRKARAEAILGKIDSSSTALFVDAAKYGKKDAYVVTVVNAKGSLVNAATVSPASLTKPRNWLSRSFSSGFVSAAAASIVNKTTAEANEGEDHLTQSYGSRPTWVTSHPPQPATLTRGLTS